METLVILGGSAGVGAIIFVIGFLLGRFIPKYVGPKPVEELFNTAILPPEIET